MMNKDGGFIVLHRKILDWEWYKNINTFRLFVYLLLTANYEDGRFEGKVISRGQLVTSLSSMSAETGLSIQQTRTSLEHLISTGEITNKSYTKYRVITITNYDKYQDRQQTKQQTNNKQLTNKPTNNQQQYNNNNNINKETNNKSLTRFIAPTLDEVTAFIAEKGFHVNPEEFYYHYQQSGWVLKGGQKMKDWKAALWNWERRRINGFQQNGPGRDHQDDKEQKLAERIRSGVTYL